MNPATFNKIRQLQAKKGETKIRTPLLSESSVLDWRSVADGFGQFSIFLFTLNHISYKELHTFLLQVKVSNPNQK
jgi:hypothetical protein